MEKTGSSKVLTSSLVLLYKYRKGKAYKLLPSMYMCIVYVSIPQKINFIQLL